MIFEGLDTETINGECSIIATSKEYKRTHDFKDITDFLFKPEYENNTFMLWNLRYDSEAILKHLLTETNDNWRNVALACMSKKGYKTNEDFNISYIPNKLLKFKHKEYGLRVFYDISQFYEYHTLDSMSQKYLGDNKTDFAQWVNQCIAYDNGDITYDYLLNYMNTNEDLIGRYCKKDAELTLRLTKFMESSFILLNFPFSNPLSMAKLAEIHELRNYQYPRITKAMSNSHNFAINAFAGGMFESRIRGYINQPIYNYDKNSAYPHKLSELEHLANGHLRWIDKPTKDKTYGWYLVTFDCKYIPYKVDLPFYRGVIIEDIEYKIELSKKQTYYPHGIRRQIITYLELDFLKRNGFNYKVHGGLEWYKDNDKYQKPFEWMKEAYILRRDIKQKDKEDIRQLTLKKMYNSGYGKTAQKKHGYGKMSNFFYASLITAALRCDVSQIAYDNEKDIIEIATDGVYSLKPITGLKEGNELGEWEKTIYNRGLFIGSGMKQLYKTSEYETFFRGISNDRKLNILQILKDNKNKTEIVFNKKRPIHLNECILQVHKRELGDLNKFQNVGRKLSVNTDKKHIWSREYKNFGDLLNNRSYASNMPIFEVNKYVDKYKEA